MIVSFSRFSIVGAMILLAPLALAQKNPTGTGRSTGMPGSTVPTTPDADLLTSRPLFVSGSVIMQGGIAPPDSVVIERACNGVLRREGYTDSKGQFQFELGRNMEQDATATGQRADITPSLKIPGRSLQSKYEGCELRAVLPGFRSTSVPLRVEDDFGQVRVGTIVLTRLGGVEGATISMTSMTAPKEARQAYEQAKKAKSVNRLDDAEKALTKAVDIYANYAVAWSLLGEIHTMQNHLDQATADYNRAVSSDPQYVTPYFGLALIAVNQKRWQDAVRFTEQVTRLNAFAYPTAYFYNAAAYYNLGKMDLAEQSARKFQSMDSENHRPDAALLLGQILINRQDYQGAAQQLRAYLAAAPDAANAEQIKGEVQRLENLAAPQQK
jgi:tetratricopeptide (TPR) repeat protein